MKVIDSYGIAVVMLVFHGGDFCLFLLCDKRIPATMSLRIVYNVMTSLGTLTSKSVDTRGVSVVYVMCPWSKESSSCMYYPVYITISHVAPTSVLNCAIVFSSTMPWCTHSLLYSKLACSKEANQFSDTTMYVIILCGTHNTGIWCQGFALWY